MFIMSPILICMFLLVVPLVVVESRFLVKTLPGLHGDLPVTLETGYIGVGESNDVQLFYQFVESEGNPEKDPLMLMITGGPGCSALVKILSGTGPFNFNYENSTLEKPMLQINPYSWTKAVNILTVDQPAGSGFSYAKTPEAYITNDTLASLHAYQFLRKWLVDHPKFLKNPLYLFSDSYAGIVQPLVVQEIYNGNEVGEEPYINIKGYVLGNALTDTSDAYNSRISFAHRMALLSDTIYKSTKENCNGEYLNVDPNNSLCKNDLQVVHKLLESINKKQILDPYCDAFITLKSALRGRGLKSLDKTSMDLLSLPQIQKESCPSKQTVLLEAWANRRDVREALHIHEETKEIEWVACNQSLKFFFDKEAISYTHNVWSSVPYHRKLAEKNCQALVYSGDHDMVVPYMSTIKWIESLKFPFVEDWRPWFVDEQVAGYTVKYSNHDYNLTFATVKGGGHVAPDYKPQQCLSMLMRWLANEAL